MPGMLCKRPGCPPPTGTVPVRGPGGTSGYRRTRRFFPAIGLCLVLIGLIAGPGPRTSPARADTPKQPQNDKILVFAAASLTDVLPALAAAWEADTREKAAGTADNHGNPPVFAPDIRFSFAASATLARQIAAGAPAHLYISANRAWTDFLSAGGHLDGAPRSLVRNRLVLVRPAAMGGADTDGMSTGTMDRGGPETGGPEADRIEAGPEAPAALTRAQLIAWMNGRPLALADPDTAPAGQYARTYLTDRGLWPVPGRGAALSANARQTLALIERGGLTGFIYESDLSGRRGLIRLFSVPDGPRTGVLYQAALTGHVEQPAGARAFLNFLTGAKAAPIWRRHGFRPLAGKADMDGAVPAARPHDTAQREGTQGN